MQDGAKPPLYKLIIPIDSNFFILKLNSSCESFVYHKLLYIELVYLMITEIKKKKEIILLKMILYYSKETFPNSLTICYC